MISKRKRSVNDLIEMLVFWDIASQAICLEHKIQPNELKALLIFFYIQQRTNDLVSVEEFTKLFTQHHQQLIGHLERHGLVERSRDLVNVTIKGEYLVRGCSRILNQKMNEGKISKWRRLKIDDERMKYLRRPGINGVIFYE